MMKYHLKCSARKFGSILDKSNSESGYLSVYLKQYKSTVPVVLVRTHHSMTTSRHLCPPYTFSYTSIIDTMCRHCEALQCSIISRLALGTSRRTYQQKQVTIISTVCIEYTTNYKVYQTQQHESIL